MTQPQPAPAASTDVLAKLRTLVREERFDWKLPLAKALEQVAFEPLTSSAWAELSWYGPLEPWLCDGQVSDIFLNAPNREVFIVREGAQRATGEHVHGSWIGWLQTQLALRSGCISINKADQWQDSYDPSFALVSGTADHRLRFALTRPPVSPDGPSVAVRVLPHRWPTLDDLVLGGVLPRLAAEQLVAALTAGVSLVIGGVTGSGKTTLAAAALQAVGAGQRVVIIEDTRELPTPPNSVAMDAGRSSASFAQLVRFALRQKPGLLVVGEVRGPEALAMLEGISSGHAGITTIHASGVQSSLANIQRLALGGGVPEGHIRAMLTAADGPLLVCHIGRTGAGRRVTAISEVLEQGASGTAGGPYPLNPLWQWDEHGAHLKRCYGVERAWGAGRW